MEEEKRKAYSEVVEILKLIENEERLEKIPFEVIQLIKGNSDYTYKPEISKEIPLEEQNLRNETYAILGWIASKYWGEDICEIKRKQEVTNIQENKFTEDVSIEENEFIENIEDTGKIVENQEIRNASVYNDIEPEAMELNEKLPMLIKDTKWYEKVKIQVINLIKFIFRLGKNQEREGVNE